MDNKQTFTILWVENNFDVIGRNEKQIKPYFEENLKDFDLNIIRSKPEDIKKNILDIKNIDIIVTDFKLGSESDGFDIIKLIKKKRCLTDIFFYTAGKFDLKKEEIQKKSGYYEFLKISEGTKDVYDDIIKIIEKNLKRCNDIIFLRGMVISRIIDLEQRMNDCFETHFKIPVERLDEFRNFVLENRFNSLIGKVKTISKVLKKHKIEKDFEGLIKKIQKLEEQRNILAHCKTDKTNPNRLVSMGDNEEFNRDKILKILENAHIVDDQLDQLLEKVKSL